MRKVASILVVLGLLIGCQPVQQPRPIQPGPEDEPAREEPAEPGEPAPRPVEPEVREPANGTAQPGEYEARPDGTRVPTNGGPEPIQPQPES